MNKKIGFIFLVLLCSLNLTIFASKEAACTIYSSETGSLDVSVSKHGDKSYEITIDSYANCKLKIISFKLSKAGFDFVAPKTIGVRGQIKVIVTFNGKKLPPLSASDISISAKECH